jgi:serine-type D-Ala-D-Ala carboxypeptidase (penicillin-binding protein 5/6)
VRPLKALFAAAASALVLSSSALAGPPPVQVGAYIVENGATGEILAASDARQRRAIASITKLMTVLLTLEHARLNAVVTVPQEVTTVGESSIELRQGERISVRDLIEAALIPSANDAADTLAYYVGHGSQARFVAMMNAKARELGLRCTHFNGVSGIVDRDNHSCAAELAVIAHLVLKNRLLAPIVASRSAILPFPIKGGKLYLYNNNPLLRVNYPGADGVKTGFTDASGPCLVAAARRGQAWLGVVLLHSADPSGQAQALLNAGFAKLRGHPPT